MNMEAPVARTRRIGELLVGKGVVSEDQVRIALTEQKNSHNKEHLGKILVVSGLPPRRLFEMSSAGRWATTVSISQKWWLTTMW